MGSIDSYWHGHFGLCHFLHRGFRPTGCECDQQSSARTVDPLLLSEFGSEEMRIAIHELTSWRLRDIELQRQTAEELQRFRRPVSYYFQKVHELHRSRIIKDSVVRATASRGQAELYLALEPLERHNNPQYDTSSFAFFADFYELPRANIGPGWRST